jgi:TRAP-type C4-dicarboxylate transport system permease small subunit
MTEQTEQTEPNRPRTYHGIGRVLAATDRVLVRITWLMRILAGAVIVAMMLTTGYDVVMRYVFAAPTEWALTLNAAGVLAATFLALPHLAAVRGHISMDLLYRRLSRRGQVVADAVTAVAAFAFGAAMAWLGYRAALTAYVGGIVTSGNFNIPLWSVYGLIYVGGLGLLLVVLFSPWRLPVGTDQHGETLSTEEGVS